MRYDYHIAVIGAGSGGLVVASGASSLGAKVLLIEGDKMGGDCLNTGCVPSKSFLKSAHLAAAIHKSKDMGLEVSEPIAHLDMIMHRVHSIIKEIEPHDSKERFENLGVDVIEGYGQLIDKHTIRVGNQTFTAGKIVLSTGSEPLIPPIKGLNEVDYYTNKNIFELEALPKRLIVLGGGPIGSELGQGFAHLGSKVTLVDMAKSLFSKDDPEVGPLMHQRFLLDGMTLELGATILEVNQTNRGIEVTLLRDNVASKVVGDALLVALGRKPNTDKLGLKALDIKTGPQGHIITNDTLQTSTPNIYACGDVTGPYAFTHTAGYQAGLLIQNTIFPFKKKVNYDAVPWVTYTVPEVAHVGKTEPQLTRSKIPYKKYMVPLANNDRAKADEDKEGFLKLLTKPNGTVIGATMVGEKAGEQIGLANMAIVQKLKLSSFMSMTFPYPTELELYKSAALLELKENFKPWQKELLKRLFLK